MSACRASIARFPCELPFGLGRQTFPGPFAVGDGAEVGHGIDRHPFPTRGNHELSPANPYLTLGAPHAFVLPVGTWADVSMVVEERDELLRRYLVLIDEEPLGDADWLPVRASKPTGGNPAHGGGVALWARCVLGPAADVRGPRGV